MYRMPYHQAANYSWLDFGGMIFVWLWLIICLAPAILQLIGLWRIYEKAGEKGWKSLVPFYNMYIWTRIVNRPVWWFAMLFVPLVNVVFKIMLTHDLSKSFGKDVGTTMGLIFLPFIFYMILAFDQSEYKKIKREEGFSD